MLDRRVADELEIMRLLARLAQATDDRDVHAYRDCLADEVLSLSPGGVRQRESGGHYAERAIHSVSTMEWTHHRLCNFVVEVDGDSARTRVDVVVEMQTQDGERALVTLGGRYDLEFARLASGWRITRRHMTTRYTIGDQGIVDRARHRPTGGAPTHPPPRRRTRRRREDGGRR